MKVETTLSTVSVGPGVFLNKLFLLLVILLALPGHSRAQDPLNATYAPSPNCSAASYPSYVWLTDDMVKVRQDSGTPAGTPCVTIYGTQAEFVSFQVHLHASSAITNYAVTVSNFVQSAPSSYTIPCSSTYDCVVYREAYMHVSPTVSGTASTFYNSTGYYPDILIPTIDPYYHQTTNAFPFTISAGNNQSAWVDILIPAAAPAGYYSGTATITGNGVTIATLPVTIGIWQWPASGHMPLEPTLLYTNATSYNTLCIQQGGSCSSTYPDGAQGEAIDLGALAADHRLNNSAGNQDFPNTGSFTTFNSEYGPLLSGTNPGKNVSTILSGAKANQMEIQCGGGCSIPSATTQAIWQNWMTNFQSKGWSSALAYGVCDEPSNSQWPSIITSSAALHSYTSPMVPLGCTTSIQNMLAGGGSSALNAVDQLVVNVVCMDPFSVPYGSCGVTQQYSGSNLQLPAYSSYLSGNCCGTGSPTRQIWDYISCSGSGTCGNGTPGDSSYSYPNYDIDGFPVANRALEWLTFAWGESGELYYAYDCQWTTSCAGSSADPWTTVYEFGGWGDGTLIYPGTTAHVGVSTPIYLPSIRLKLIRDGVQDYEYMTVLNNNGKGTIITAQIATWLTNAYTFNVNPYAASGSFTGSLETARMALGNAMHQLTYPVVLLPPPSLSGTLQP
jgi:hypothetical protein